MPIDNPRSDAPNSHARDGVAIAATLIALAGLAWVYVAHQAMMMGRIDHAGMMGPPRWSLLDVVLLFAMWEVMMVAMMTPAVVPMTVAYATINRRRKERGAPYVATSIFVAGYLMAWAGFSALATAVQIGLHTSGLLDPMMAQTSGVVAAALFLAAGLYQWSPLKDVCLTRCRSTEGFILSEWRDGPSGAVVMGLKHGLFCIGCCAPLMALLFAVSVMDLRWVAGLTAIVMVEKLLPHPEFWRRLIGAGLIVTAIVMAVRSFIA